MNKEKFTEPNTEKLVTLIIEAIREKKGHDILIINLQKIPNAVCDYFVICHGTSDVQVETIAEHIREYVREQAAVKPSHIEGMDNAQWVLMDYFHVVVHIFHKDSREFYRLEDVWADAEVCTAQEFAPEGEST